MERIHRRRATLTLRTTDPDHAAGKEQKRPCMSRAVEAFQNRCVASFRRLSRANDDGRGRPTNASALIHCFFRLPNELRAQIICELSISDILALRQTCRALYDLISACDSHIVRFWVKYRLGSLHTRLYPPPPPDQADLRYLLAMRRRHIASIRLTSQLTKFVLKDTMRTSCPRRRQMWKSVYDKMLPLVFTVGYILEEHRRIVLERDLGTKRSPDHPCYDVRITPAITEEEREIIRRLDPPMRLQYFYMYCFMVQVLTSKLRPPKCAGAVEKFVRGWTSEPACSEDIAFALVLGGISQVGKLLASKNYSERRKHLHSFITRLAPYETAGWKEHWRNLGIDCTALSLDDIPTASIGITQLDEILVPLMESSLESREYTEAQRERYAELKMEKKFINELMGYDIWRHRGRPANEEDSENEDSHEL